VYDLYCAQINNHFEQDDLSVQKIILVSSDVSSCDEISDNEYDSNAESNERNDYPDSDYDVEIDNDDFADNFGERYDETDDTDNVGYCYYRKVREHYHSDTSDDEIDNEYGSDEDYSGDNENELEDF